MRAIVFSETILPLLRDVTAEASREFLVPGRAFADVVAYLHDRQSRFGRKRGEPDYVTPVIARKAERAMYQFSRRAH